MKTVEYLAVCIPVPDGGLSIMFPDVKGCVSYGRNIDEARRNAFEALSLHADGVSEDGDELPPPIFSGEGIQPNDIVIHVSIPVKETVLKRIA